MIRYRLNAININSIADFGRVRGQITDGLRQVYIVKFVGSDGSIFENIKELKSVLKDEQSRGRIRYKYIDDLNITNDYSKYQKAYEAFLDKRNIDLDIIKSGRLSESDLTNALAEMEKILYMHKKNASLSIIKNIMVKLLYWLEEKFAKEDIKVAVGASIKIICENIIKESQVCFFVFLNLLGMDVCMLQYGMDTDFMSDYFNKKVLGDFILTKSIWQSIPEEVKDSVKKVEDAVTKKAQKLL